MNDKIDMNYGGRASRVVLVDRPLLYLIIGSFMIAFDLWTKWMAFNSDFGNLLDVLSPVAGKQNFKNFDFAFSWPLPLWMIYLIYFAVLALMTVYAARANKNFSFAAKIAWTLIYAGALANIGERIALGYVRDFIYIYHGIFNLADGYIILGIAILMTRMSKNDKIDKNGPQ